MWLTMSLSTARLSSLLATPSWSLPASLSAAPMATALLSTALFPADAALSTCLAALFST